MFDYNDISPPSKISMPPLRQSKRIAVKKALFGQGSDDDIMASNGSDSVQRKSMCTLRSGKWLNDEVITYYLKMLASRDEALSKNEPNRKRSHFFMSFFVTKLLDVGCTNGYTYKHVKHWSTKVPGKDIFNLKNIFFPININQSHWACAVIYMQEKRIQYYDSMGSGGSKYLSALMTYLEDEWADKKSGDLPDKENWTILNSVDGVPLQHNGCDCAVFTLMYADFLSLDRPLSFDQNYITNGCREHIASSILNGAIIESFV